MSEYSNMFWYGYIARCLVAAVCFISAAYLINRGVESGWGWLIFAGIIATPTTTSE